MINDNNNIIRTVFITVFSYYYFVFYSIISIIFQLLLLFI